MRLSLTDSLTVRPTIGWRISSLIRWLKRLRLLILRQIRKNLNAAVKGLIDASRTRDSNRAYLGVNVYLGRKEGWRFGWKRLRRGGRSDCGRNAEAQNCTKDRRGKGTNLFVPSTWGGWILLATISKGGKDRGENLTL